jgi:hypothetical protein
MKRDPALAAVFAAAVLLCLLPSTAAGQTGSIRGKTDDGAGVPVPGVYLYLSSPALIATLNAISSERGDFWFASLPPGTYTIVAEKPGHKTVTVKGILLSPGSGAAVDIGLEPTEIEEEPSAFEFHRVLDPSSAADRFWAGEDILSRMPIPRDFSHVLGLVPGVVFENGRPDPFPAIHGGAAGSNVTLMDGSPVSDPVTGAIPSRINLDFIDEIVVETVAHPADRGPAEAGWINIIHKSGGDTGGGEVMIYHTGGALSKSLFSPGDLEDMDVMPPLTDKRLWDFSLSVGGPVVQDVARMFMSLRYASRHRTTPFMPWGDPLGTMHWDYFFDDKDFSGLVKLAARVENKYSGYLEFGTSKVRQPAYEPDISWNTPRESTRTLDRESSSLIKAGFTYILGPVTLVDLFAGFSNFKQPLVLNTLGAIKPSYIDLASGYVWGSAALNDLTENGRFTGGVTLTTFMDRLLGGPHEIKIGIEYESMTGQSSAWKYDNLTYYYSSGDPYLYGQAVSPESGETVGLGLIAFAPLPWEKGGLAPKKDLSRIGAFVQDNLTFAGRFTLSLGLRFDRSEASIPSYVKGTSGNPVSVAVGEDLIKPSLGLNPFVQALLTSWNEIVTWNTFSPRAAVSIDLFGKGKTLVKASLARYPESLRLGYSEMLLPLDKNRVHQFYWYDENGDAAVDEEDTFAAVPEDYRIYQQELYESRIDPSLRPPTTDEWTAGLEQEIGRGFTFAARAIFKTQKNIVGRVLYDPDTGTPSYTPEGAAADWWVPFATTVPAAEGYPETPVTVYFPAEDAPDFFDRFQNVPELRRKYRAFEFTLRKRWSGRWQLAGSVVFGRSTGTSGLVPGWSSGIAASALSPNSLVNVTDSSRLDLDRPVSLKLMGTARLPWDVFLSLYFRAASGSPWARTVTVVPPESWAQENGAQTLPVSVYLESPGSRRRESWKNLDLGLTKEFHGGGKAFLAVSLDVLNVLGDTTRLLDLNDGGLWYPSDEGTSEGERVLSGTYNKVVSVWGTRTVALKFNLKF